MAMTTEIIQRYRLNLRYLAAKLSINESILRFHLRREPSGKINPEFKAQIRKVIRDHAAGILNDLEN